MVVCPHDLWSKFMLVLFLDHEWDWCSVKTPLKVFDAILLDSSEYHLYCYVFRHSLNVMSFFLGHTTKFFSHKFKHLKNWLFYAQATRELRYTFSTKLSPTCFIHVHIHKAKGVLEPIYRYKLLWVCGELLKDNFARVEYGNRWNKEDLSRRSG